MDQAERKQLPAEPDDLCATLPPRDTARRPLSYLPANLQGIGRREKQEDAFAFGNALDEEAIARGGLLMVVADGMGGMAGGKIASMTAVSSLLAAFKDFDMEGDLVRQLEDAVFAASEEVEARLHGAGGSTVLAALIYNEKLYFTSVGDSYFFLLHNRQLTRLNRSQNLLNAERRAAIRSGVLDPHGPDRNPDKEAITHFIGMPGLDETDSLRCPLPLAPGDVLLLCSDGVGGVLSGACIEDCLSFGVPTDMCAALETEIKRANLRYQDNYTALVIQCRN